MLITNTRRMKPLRLEHLQIQQRALNIEEEGLDSKVVVYDVESNLGICFARKLENSMEYMRRQMVEK